jgi:choline dehydrogenase-like flavoprotein/UDP-2,3-diacylglucosamine pyrophosphatase LpxH
VKATGGGRELPLVQPGVAEFPVEPDLILALSDLHMAAGRNLATGRYAARENFFADESFGEFLAQQQPGSYRNPLLVLNGDIFDFLRITEVPRSDRDFRTWAEALRELGAPQSAEALHQIARREYAFGLRTHDYKSVWKLLVIANGHPAFFEALGRWIEQGGWILFVKGNHDVELYWPLVHQAIRRAIGGGDPGRAALAQDRVVFCQEGVRIANVYFEHGNQYESTTRLLDEPVLRDGVQLAFPLGSFVNRYLINSLEWLDPFLDNIRPRKALLQKILKRHPLQVFRILRHAIPMLRRAMRPYWLRDSFGLIIYLLALLLPIATLAVIMLVIFGVHIPILSGWPPRYRWVGSALGLTAPYLLGIVRSVFPKWRPRVGEDEFAAKLHETLARVDFPAGFPAFYGVLGHTHLPDVQLLPGLHGSKVYYLNTGTWTPLWREDRPDLTGQVQHSVVRFQRSAAGYRHELLDWIPATRRLEPPLLWSPRRRATSGFLNDREFRTVAAFSDVFIDGQAELISPGVIAKRIDEQLARIWSKRMRSIKLALFAVEFLLPLLAGRWRFSRQPVPARRRLIDRYLVRPSTGRLGRNLAKVRALFLAGYYGDPVVQKAIGLVPVAERERYHGKPPQPRGLAPLKLEPARAGESEIRAEICVIGSGAGGAVIAAHAAAAGYRVVLVEEGRYFHSSRISHHEGDMAAALYKEGGLQTTSDLGMTILQGRALGGTTLINNGISFRLRDPDLNADAPDVLAQWAKLGAQVDPHLLEDSYKRVSKRIGVDFLPDEVVGASGTLLLEGWKALRAGDSSVPAFPAKKFKTNFPGCAGCGFCNFGCPYERKLSMLETYITDASGSGSTRILTECHAVRIESKDTRVTGVQLHMAGGRSLRVSADLVVVACGAIGSSVLLRKSKITRNVGTRISFNLAAPMLARFADPVNSWDGIQMATYVDAGDFLLESSFNPPLTFAVSLPGWFRTHFERMTSFAHFAGAGAVIPTTPSGRLQRWAWQRNLLGPVAYRMSREEFAVLRQGLGLLARIYFAAGAECVFPASFADLPMLASEFAPRGLPDARRINSFLTERLRKPEDLTLNSSHPQGGNPMSDNRSIGAVGSDFRVHGYQNLYVCDASVFPTSIRVNPQLTIMAMADYAWQQFISKRTP